jgi:REP element-mobilizing transposase RayT
VEEELSRVCGAFAVDCCAYAVMSNHVHTVLHVAVERAASWSEAEVAERAEGLWPIAVGQLQASGQWGRRCAEYRERLSSLSWFMRVLNERIARRANKEDGVKGRFWEGRFKSRPLLDEGALLACMAYVDLNPVRAGLAETLAESEFTSIAARLAEVGEEVAGLAAVVSGGKDGGDGDGGVREAATQSGYRAEGQGASGKRSAAARKSRARVALMPFAPAPGTAAAMQPAAAPAAMLAGVAQSATEPAAAPAAMLAGAAESATEPAANGGGAPAQRLSQPQHQSQQPAASARAEEAPANWLPMNFEGYVDLVRFTGQAMRADKPCALPARLPPELGKVIAAAGLSEGQWLRAVRDFPEERFAALGECHLIREHAQRAGKQHGHGIAWAQRAYLAAA